VLPVSGRTCHPADKAQAKAVDHRGVLYVPPLRGEGIKQRAARGVQRVFERSAKQSMASQMGALAV
jgi:hypothetical protein